MQQIFQKYPEIHRYYNGMKFTSSTVEKSDSLVVCVADSDEHSAFVFSVRDLPEVVEPEEPIFL